MSKRRWLKGAAVLASISTVSMLASPVLAQAYDQGYDQGYGQGYDQSPPPGYNANDIAPPSGQYAPTPYGDNYGGSYDNRDRDYDRDYAQQYSGWAAQNCVDRRNTNTVAGAIIGGVLGAVIGSNVARRGERTGGSVIGGVVGATAGGAIGHASTDNAGCPPGYVTRAGAPSFDYGGQYAGPAYSTPSWYHPWSYSNGQWNYRPYRSWYYDHPDYWSQRSGGPDYAQGYGAGGPDYTQGYGNGGAFAPPAGQYAPPPPGAYSSYYDNRAQAFDRDYAGRYSYWASRNCIDRRNNNTVAGAVIGGVLGAVIGSNVAGRGDRGAGTVVGGALGATAGAAIASSSSNNYGCPPGYYVRPGAPAFYYGGGYSGQPYYGPSWYRPWYWNNGRWYYRPYRQWYYNNPRYWRNGGDGRRDHHWRRY